MTTFPISETGIFIAGGCILTMAVALCAWLIHKEPKDEIPKKPKKERWVDWDHSGWI